ncbi:MAG: 6-phosphogluconolactonase [Phycisphaerales bacterium]
MSMTRVGSTHPCRSPAPPHADAGGGLPLDPVALHAPAAPPKPALPGTVVLRPDADALIDAIAADIMIQAVNCVRAFGDFHIALSGGSTPFPLYKRLMYDPRYRELPWKRTHLWIVDERRVPFDDDKSNFKHIREIIADHADIPANNVHPMMAMQDDADTAYEREMQQALAWREKGQDRLDFVLLGMGGDGHTASLFPRSPALNSGEEPRMILINSGPNVTPPDRVTMTYYLLNASRFIGVMCVGEGKKAMLAKIAAAKNAGTSHEDLPILGVKPHSGEMRWYLDYAACP